MSFPGGSSSGSGTVRRRSIVKGISQNALGIANRVVAASPILEAFGNASTLRNPNSSRFGRWMELTFDGNNHITGSTITSYLLEVGRVTATSPGERSYHIFYQILRGMDKAELQQLGVSSACVAHRYLAGTATIPPTASGSADGGSSNAGPPPTPGEAPDLKDAENFHELRSAFVSMGIPSLPAPQGSSPPHLLDSTSLFSLIAGILLLGNVEFASLDEGEASRVCDESDGTGGTVRASRLLGVEDYQLKESLCKRTITSGARKSVVTVSLTSKRAAENRDSLARAIYGRVFTYVIACINKQNETSVSGAGAAVKCIGLLDVFGFEIFQRNRYVLIF